MKDQNQELKLKDATESPERIIVTDGHSTELDFSSSPALKALSIFREKYSWDKGLVKA